MVSLVKHAAFEVVSALAICGAIVATMFVTYLCLASAKKVVSRIGPQGIDAATRIVGFFVSAMGMGLIFHGSSAGYKGTHLRRDTVIPQWFQASKAAAASDGYAVYC